MRLFSGLEVEKSVVIMRMISVVNAAAVLLWALIMTLQLLANTWHERAQSPESRSGHRPN